MPFLGWNSFTPGSLEQVSDAVTLTASGVLGVGGVPKIYDVGNGLAEAIMVHIGTTALDTSSGDEIVRFIMQGSNSATFASGIAPLAEIQIGKNGVIDGDILPSPIGHHLLVGVNQYLDILYRYVRIYAKIAGTTPSVTINDAWLTLY